MRAVDAKRKEENGVYYKELLSRFLGMSGPDYVMVMADATMVRMAWVALVKTMSIKRKATNLKGHFDSECERKDSDLVGNQLLRMRAAAELHITEHDVLSLGDPEVRTKITYNLQACSGYHGPVAKKWIALQLCGWNRSLELCTGAIDDSNYLRMVKVFEGQENFAAEDKSSSQTFVNVLDKGYRSVLDSLMCGQRCLQPAFAKSDEQFRCDQTLHSGCVAVVRSGNERSVKRSKISWLVKRGCVDQMWDLSMLADVWLVWGFQVNFMYDTVL
jgi:hypothetical protein